MVGEEYPFTHFCSVVVFPFVYWVGMIETAAWTSNDNAFELSFGQILAIFVAIPPMISVAKLFPRFGRYIWNLHWICLVTGRKKIQEPIQWMAYVEPHKRHSTALTLTPVASRQSTLNGAWEGKQDIEDGYEGYTGYSMPVVPSPGLMRGDEQGRYVPVGSPR
jgi:hypothetical protein